LDKFGLRDLFDRTISREWTGGKCKPSGDALVHLARVWDTNPAKLVMVGDWKDDLAAGKDAGAVTVLKALGADAQRANGHLAAQVNSPPFPSLPSRCGGAEGSEAAAWIEHDPSARRLVRASRQTLSSTACPRSRLWSIRWTGRGHAEEVLDQWLQRHKAVARGDTFIAPNARIRVTP